MALRAPLVALLPPYDFIKKKVVEHQGTQMESGLKNKKGVMPKSKSPASSRRRASKSPAPRNAIPKRSAKSEEHAFEVRSNVGLILHRTFC
jgi:hypothetical protein